MYEVPPLSWFVKVTFKATFALIWVSLVIGMALVAGMALMGRL